MTKKINITSNSKKEIKLLSDFRSFRSAIKDRLNLYHSFPAAKKELWLANDPLLLEVLEFAKRVNGGKHD